MGRAGGARGQSGREGNGSPEVKGGMGNGVRCGSRKGEGGLRGRMYTVLGLMFSVVFLTGCRLALEEPGTRKAEDDRLAGVFVTERHIDSGTPEIKRNRKGEASAAENREEIRGRLVATGSGGPDIAFEGIEGYGIYHGIRVQEAQDGGASHSFADELFSDLFYQEGDANRVEATIYVSAEGSDTFYFNPVYQTVQGDLYMLPGSGLTTDRTEGTVSTHTLRQERKITADGKETVESEEFIIHIACAERTASYRLLFMDAENNVLSVMTGEELLKTGEERQWELSIAPETAYLILERAKSSGEVERTICSRGEERLEFLRYLGDGYLVRQQACIVWE